jgi:hypothetical protein
MLLAILSCSLLLPFQGGEKYESKAHQFKLAFPGKPEEQTMDATSDVGKLKFHITVWDGGDKAVIVSKVDYPVDPKAFDAQLALDKGIVGAEKGATTKAHNIVKTTYSTKKLPSRTFDLEKQPGIWGRNLLVIQGTRMYHVVVMGDKKYIHSKAADAIIASFEITK